MDASNPLADLRVLVIEDDTDMRLLVRAMLRRMGVERIVVAVDGVEALEKAKDAASFDIVVCDWNMPRMSGIEALKHFRARSARTRVLMMTARTDVFSVRRAQQAGAAAYLVKPFSEGQLKAKIAALAGERPLWGDVLPAAAAAMTAIPIAAAPIAAISARTAEISRR
jgi:two-component system chemotaxis response regulator CheY